jgi:hypothetical protein
MLIDRYEESWLDLMNRRMLSLEEGVNLYLLIDGAFIPGLHRKFNSAFGEKSVGLLFETLPSCSTAVRDVSPFLLRIDAAARPDVEGLLKTCDGFPMISSIETQETSDKLIARLAGWCIVYVGNQRFNLRFPDTRRLACIHGALTQEQRGQLTGPATRWSYIGRSGSWSDLMISASDAPSVQTTPVLTETQFSVMLNDSEADEILAVLTLQDRVPDRRPSQLYETATRALRLADMAALTDGQRRAWCQICLAQGNSTDDAVLISKMKRWIETLPV